MSSYTRAVLHFINLQRAWCDCVQVLQKAAQWCPNPDKVFVNAAGELVEPQAITQQAPAAANAATPGSQAQPEGTPLHAQ